MATASAPSPVSATVPASSVVAPQTLRLINRLRAGDTLETAASLADLPLPTASVVASSPLAKALSGR